jgi:hypothetical protein
MSRKLASYERRWAAISSDGRHVWLGRASDPTESELATLTGQLSSLGATAWLAVVEGEYLGTKPLTILPVKELTGSGSWSDALANFLVRRESMTESIK